MAWTSPTTPYFSVSEVVTAVKMNVLSDDLRYLRGLDGAVNVRSSFAVTDVGSDITPASLLHLHSTTLTGATMTFSSAAPGFIFQDHVSSASRTMLGALGFGTAAGHFGGGAGDINFATGSYAGGQSSGIRFSTARDTSGNYDTRMYIAGGLATGAGKVGINTAAPAAPIHVMGAGGGFLFVSCNAVDGTLQTPIVAGTVTQYIQYNGSDRNNGTGTCVTFAGTAATLGSTFTVVNSDTVTIAVTAGGAITVQRTAGSSGTHQINFWIMYK